MNRSMRRAVCLLLAVGLCLPLMPRSRAADQFSDVPQSSYAYQDILSLRQMGIVTGIGGGQYGIGMTFRRCDLVLMLARLLGWQTASSSSGFADVPQSHYAASAIAAAVEHGVVDAGGNFRPGDAITRRELAVMLSRACSAQGVNLARQAARQSASSPFTDVPKSDADFGAIRMAYDFGIINGMSSQLPTQFQPAGVATREQAAAMMMRFYRRTQGRLGDFHAFYAISSWQQRGLMASMDTVSAGWARMEYSGGSALLNTTSAGGNSWAVPSGSEQVFALARQNGSPLLLGVYMDTSATVSGGTQPQATALLTSESARAQAVAALAAAVGEKGFDGVTIDFESFVSEGYRAPFTAFLQQLRKALPAGKLLYCAVPPKDYYRGYDYRAIGEVCDKVILMAHDYEITTMPDSMKNTQLPETPIASIGDVYRSLEQITDTQTGVRDRSKILLALSFGTARWEIVNGRVSHDAVKQSDYASIASRLAKGDSKPYYNEEYQSPYLSYYDASDGTTNVVWYENSRSIKAKCELARLFGLGGVSFWRLGTIPDMQGFDLDVASSLSSLRGNIN